MSIEYCNGIPILTLNTVSKTFKESDKVSYYISYNPSSRDYGCDTTALVIVNNIPTGKDFRTEKLTNKFVWNGENFYILNGDHSSAFSKCNSLQECIEYYKENLDKVNRLSSDIEGWIEFIKENKVI